MPLCLGGERISQVINWQNDLGIIDNTKIHLFCPTLFCKIKIPLMDQNRGAIHEL